MKKRLKRLLCKKGLSLVEVLVVLFISSILIGCAMGMLTPVNNLMNSIKGNAHLDALCDTANEYMRGSLQNAVGISVLTYDSAGTTALISTQIVEYSTLATASNDYDLKVKALAVLKNADGNFRLYDFGAVDSTTIDSLLSSPSDENHGVFMNDYYEGTSLAVTFGNASPTTVNITDSEGNIVESYQSSEWLKIYSRCYKNGNINNQIRGLSFKIFGGNVRFGGNASAVVTTNADGISDFDIAELKDGLVIVYLTKDFNSPKSPITPSP